MLLFKRKQKTRCFHVVFSATFETGTKLCSAEMTVNGGGLIQNHILESWRKTIAQESKCTNPIIINFIEIDASNGC